MGLATGRVQGKTSRSTEGSSPLSSYSLLFPSLSFLLSILCSRNYINNRAYLHVLKEKVNLYGKENQVKSRPLVLDPRIPVTIGDQCF